VKDVLRCSPRTILLTFLNHSQRSNDADFFLRLSVFFS